MWRIKANIKRCSEAKTPLTNSHPTVYFYRLYICIYVCVLSAIHSETPDMVMGPYTGTILPWPFVDSIAKSKQIQIFIGAREEDQGQFAAGNPQWGESNAQRLAVCPERIT